MWEPSPVRWEVDFCFCPQELRCMAVPRGHCVQLIGKLTMSWPFEFLARRSWQVFLEVSFFCIPTSFTKRRHFPSWALSFAVLANSKGFCWCRKEWQSCWAQGTSPGSSIIRKIILHMTNGFSLSAQFRYSFLGVLALTLRTEEAFMILASVATDFCKVSSAWKQNQSSGLMQSRSCARILSHCFWRLLCVLCPPSSACCQMAWRSQSWVNKSS